MEDQGLSTPALPVPPIAVVGTRMLVVDTWQLDKRLALRVRLRVAEVSRATNGQLVANHQGGNTMESAFELDKNVVGLIIAASTFPICRETA